MNLYLKLTILVYTWCNAVGTQYCSVDTLLTSRAAKTQQKRTFQKDGWLFMVQYIHPETFLPTNCLEVAPDETVHASHS